ncbi:MAG: DUF123 domain-containing protein [Candidatus Nanohaloarchaea archaeon]
MKAVYAVFLELEQGREITIGALGRKKFSPGTYIYVGSAMNSVERRLERHYSRTENRHWHIDYFSEEAEAFDHFILPETSEHECVLADIFSRFARPVDGFGASDCACGSHLFHVPKSFSR